MSKISRSRFRVQKFTLLIIATRKRFQYQNPFISRTRVGSTENIALVFSHIFHTEKNNPVSFLSSAFSTCVQVSYHVPSWHTRDLSKVSKHHLLIVYRKRESLKVHPIENYGVELGSIESTSLE